jgi:chemotaxis signal transduction protein
MSTMHVHVRVGAEMYALPVAHVLEVSEIGDLTIAPGASRETLGLRNLRGEVLPVFDLGAVLGLPHNADPRRMLVAEHGGLHAGLAVDEVTGVEQLPEADQEVESDLLSRAVLIDGALVGVIDVDRLFVNLRGAS